MWSGHSYVGKAMRPKSLPPQIHQRTYFHKQQRLRWKQTIERRERTFLHFLDLRLLLIDCRAQQREDDTRLRVDSDGCDQHLAAALHHVRATENHRIRVAALFHVVRLAGQRGLINLEERGEPFYFYPLKSYNASVTPTFRSLL